MKRSITVTAYLSEKEYNDLKKTTIQSKMKTSTLLRQIINDYVEDFSQYQSMIKNRGKKNGTSTTRNK